MSRLTLLSDYRQFYYSSTYLLCFKTVNSFSSSLQLVKLNCIDVMEYKYFTWELWYLKNSYINFLKVSKLQDARDLFRVEISDWVLLTLSFLTAVLITLGGSTKHDTTVIEQVYLNGSWLQEVSTFLFTALFIHLTLNFLFKRLLWENGWS